MITKDALVAIRSREGDRVTTLELFFDLAFVFAFTQLSRLMAQEHDLTGVVQALTVLALLWWSWNSYAWLGNLAHADAGWMRLVMLTATGSMFFVGVTVLEAYHDLPGGLSGPAVFIAAYLAARLLHLVAFTAVTAPELRSRAFASTGLALTASSLLLIAGGVLGGTWQIALWLAAAAVEPIVTHWTSRGRDWPVGSAAHFTERHGLIVILALGESLIAVGTGAAHEPMSIPLALGVGSALALSAGLWWAYFSRLNSEAEHALMTGVPANARGLTARDGYTYLHLLIVAGMVFIALGLETAISHVDDAEPFGLFGAAALGGGTALFLAATAWFARRLTGRLRVVRLGGAVVAALSITVLAVCTPGAALLVTVGVVAAVLLVESLAGGSS